MTEFEAMPILVVVGTVDSHMKRINIAGSWGWILSLGLCRAYTILSKKL